ncbi:MAG: hypothetical protein AAF747_05705, partial [Planctomycetota bacterium]
MADEGPPDNAKDRDWRSMHLWQIQPVRDVLLVFAILALIGLARTLSIVTVPLLLAILLAYLFEPLIQLVTKRGWTGRRFTVIGIIVAAVVLVVVPTLAGLAFGLTQGLGFANRVGSNVEALVASLDEPDNAELEAAVPPGFWSDTRDFVLRQGIGDAIERGLSDRLDTPDDEPPAAKPEAPSKPAEQSD